jgi:hypothetical protein
MLWEKARRVWSETSRVVRRVWVFLWAAGLALLGFGIWGDQTGFWGDKPYFTNVFSALTTASFGVPLALIVLQRISATEADAAEARSARRMAAIVSADLVDSVAALVPGGTAALQGAMAEFRGQRDALVPNGDYWRPSGAPRLYYAPFIEAIDTVLQSIEGLFDPQWGTYFAEVSSQWSILTTESRARLLGAGERWLPGLQAKQVTELIGQVTGPTLADLKSRGLELQEWYRDEDRHRGRAQPYGEMKTLQEFDGWFTSIFSFMDAVMNLNEKCGLVAESFALPGARPVPSIGPAVTP